MKANYIKPVFSSTQSVRGHFRFHLFTVLAIASILGILVAMGASHAPDSPIAQAQDGSGTLCITEEDVATTTVEAIPRTPGDNARYEVKFNNGDRELKPGQDGIILHLDPQIKLPQDIDAKKIDIRYTYTCFADVKASFAASAYSVAEGGSVDVTVNLSAAPGRQIDIPLRITPQDRESAPEPRTAKVTFGSRVTKETYTIRPRQGVESVVVEFDAPLPNGVSAGTYTETTVHVNDASSPTVSFEASHYSVSEGESVTVKVLLGAAPETPVDIPLTTKNEGGASGEDYSGVPSSPLRFEAGSTSKTFTFMAISDTKVESGESVVFGVDPTEPVTPGPPGETRISITDKPVPTATAESPYDAFGSGNASSVDITRPARRGGPATLTIYPKIVAGTTSLPIPPGARVTVVIHEGAGLTNPIEGGAFQWDVGTTHDSLEFRPAQHPDQIVRNAFRRMEEAIDDHVHDDDLSGLLIDWEVELSEPTLRRGDELEITARGFAIGTTVVFWRDSNLDGVFNRRGAILCRAESNSMATAKCSIPVTNPPFVPGFGNCTFRLVDPDTTATAKQIDPLYRDSNCNFINARDGEGHTSILLLEEHSADGITLKDDVEDAFQVLELEGTVKLGTNLRTHSTVPVDLLDFPQGYLESVYLGGFRANLEGIGNRRISEAGRLSFPLTLPENVLSGRQDIRITVMRTDGDCAAVNANSNDDCLHEHHSEVAVDNALHLEASHSTALPNQRIRVTVQGFPGSAITRISMDGVEVPAFGADGRVNSNSAEIELDSSGRWVGSVILPLNGSTLVGGERKLQVRDSGGRLGETTIVFPVRRIRVSPDQSVSGETITISGEGFPVSSNRGSEAQAEITYDYGKGEFTTSVSVDASGSFSTDLTVPRAVEIPSTNLVSAMFVDDEGHQVFTHITHLVRAPGLTASPDHGPPGTTIKLTGTGLPAFTQVTKVILGELDVTPSPAPHTDRNGMVELEVLVPQSEPGAESIIVLAGGIYVHGDFQVSRPLAEFGPATPVEELSIVLGEQLLVAFHFDNSTKRLTFYDPLILEHSDLRFLIPGEVYHIQVSENAQVILNGRIRSLSCLEDNCWNQIVW